LTDKLLRASDVVLKDCMAVKPGETVLIIVDAPKKAIGEALFLRAKEIPAEAMLLEMLPRENHGVEPPQAVAEAMKAADVVIIPTSKSLSHTYARREANDRGARIATMPDITVEMMERTLASGYTEIAGRVLHYANLLSQADQVQITTPAGTDLSFSMAGRPGHADTGLVHSPGDFSNLPAGEAFGAPVEGTASGRLVVDGSMASIGRITSPIVMEVEDGYVVSVNGEAEAEKLEAILARYGRDARNIAELGIGLNDFAQLTGNALEDEKVLGTVHVALGDNSTFGGTVSVPSHLDGILLKPTLTIDGTVIIEEGRLMPN
jgi:leucyl aminopeptidase (aminopeptidase T)